MSRLEELECIEALIPFVKAFSFIWFNLHAAKRRYQKQHEASMPVEMERVMKEDFMNQRCADKIKWIVRILAKLRKNTKQQCRSDLVKIISEGNVQSPCIISNADTKNKMRRIDCLRQADKVWRLDVVMAVLFRGIPLESTDGERISKCKECKNPTLCINPYHIVIHVKELEVYLANYNNNNTQASSTNIIPSVFSTSELQHMANNSISEGVSTKEVLGADYLTSMLQMETDDHTEAQPIFDDQQPDFLKICRTRKLSLSRSPRKNKRRRISNKTSSAAKGNDEDLHVKLDNPICDVYELTPPSSSSTSTCRMSSTNDSNTPSTFSPQDQLNSCTSKSIIESSKMELDTLRPPFSPIGIHNHVPLNLYFNNQQPLPSSSKPLINSQQTSDSKLISESFIESSVQHLNDTQQRQRTSSHPHTVEFFHQEPRTEPISTISKSSPKLLPKPVTTTPINILPSREEPVSTTISFNYKTSFVQPHDNEFKDNKVNKNVACFTSVGDLVLPAFHSFSELKNYLKTIGLDLELVPTTTTTPSNEILLQRPRNIDLIQQEISSNEEQQQQQSYQVHSNIINAAKTPPQQLQMVMLSDNDDKCNRPSSISIPSKILTEKLPKYASSSSSVRASQLPSRSSTLFTQQQQHPSPSKPLIVTGTANLLSVSNNSISKEQQPIIQQVTRQILLPPPVPLPPSPPSSSAAPSTTVYHHHVTSVDTVSTMVKRDLIDDDVHSHDRRVKKYMNVTATAWDRSTEQRKTTISRTITDTSNKSIVLESGSASNSNDSNISSASSSSSSSFIPHSTNTDNNNHNMHHHANGALTNSINKSKNHWTLSSQDSRNICDILLMLYEQEQIRSAKLQKQIEEVSRQRRSRNSSEQLHLIESQIGLETSQEPATGNTNSTPIFSPAAWLSTSGKEKTSIHNRQDRHRLFKFDSSVSNNGSPSVSQDCSLSDPNKSDLSSTTVVQFSQSIGSVQKLIPRPVPMLATNDGLVRHTSSSSLHSATLTGSNNSSNNGIVYTPSNRIFQSSFGQTFLALSPALSPSLSPSTSRAGTPNEIMIIPADLLSVLNSRNWNEDELLQVLVNYIDSGDSGRRSRIKNEEFEQQEKLTSMANYNNANNNNNDNDNGQTKSIGKEVANTSLL